MDLEIIIMKKKKKIKNPIMMIKQAKGKTSYRS